MEFLRIGIEYLQNTVDGREQRYMADQNKPVLLPGQMPMFQPRHGLQHATL